MKTKIIYGIVLILITGSVKAATFPIDDENCLHKRGNILLTGWYWEDRYYGKHQALDIPAAVYTPVRSTKSGVVIEQGYQYKNETGSQVWGNYVKIRDDENYVWIYAHLTSYNVKKDELITEGQIIGLVGYTGLDEKCPHLHIEKRDTNNKKVIFTKEFGLLFSLRRPKVVTVAE